MLCKSGIFNLAQLTSAVDLWLLHHESPTTFERVTQFTRAGCDTEANGVSVDIQDLGVIYTAAGTQPRLRVYITE